MTNLTAGANGKTPHALSCADYVGGVKGVLVYQQILKFAAP